MGDYDELYDHIDEMSEIPREVPFIDAWGEEYMSPTKAKREMKKGNYKKADVEMGPLFKSANNLLVNVLHVNPKMMNTLELVFLSLMGVGRILLCTLMGMLNAFDNPFFDKSWPSINLFTGAVFIPSFNMAKAFPFWFRPANVRRFEWQAIRCLISLNKGFHVAVDIEKLNMGVIIEEVVRDRTKHRRQSSVDSGYDRSRKSPDGGRGGRRSSQTTNQQHNTPERQRREREQNGVKVAAKKKVEHFSIAFRGIMEKLKGYGINIAVNIDEIGVGVDYTKLELDGTVTRSDDWWAQGTHIRALDVGMTLSTGRSASFVSWEVLELRFLEEDDSDYDEDDEDGEEEVEDDDDDVNGRYFHLTPTSAAAAAGGGDSTTDAVYGSRDNERNLNGSNVPSAVSSASNADDLMRVQRDIARQLFDDGTSSDGGPQGQGQGALSRRGSKKEKRPKDAFARALQDAPLLSLSSFSCGANVFLELADMDFSSRSAMMSRYGEIKRLYRSSNTYSASGPAGTSSSAHFARRKHQHIRGELPGDEDDEHRNEALVASDASQALDRANSRWGMTMSAVAVSIFYAYAKAHQRR